MQTSAPLPVSVLVPTRNSIAQLPGHIKMLHGLAPVVREIVFVDSESSDGTLELIRRELPQARVVTHPPGLYESWNFGVNACVSEFVYISTVGDSIRPEGLRRLAESAQRSRADVIISPPEFRDEHGRVLQKPWPVVELIEALPLTSEVTLAPEQSFFFALAFMRQAILGSSASNLYRTECLRARPFPTDFGHGGDVGWGLRYSPEICLGIVPEKLATFVFHQRSKRVVKDPGAIRVAAAGATLDRVRAQFSAAAVAVCEDLCNAWQQVFEINTRRRERSVWMLRPSGWRDAWAHNVATVELQRAQGRAFQLIRESLRS